ncbi:MAG: TlpA disulfide reductase family protein [Candidatus Nanopelagicales bacterium]
MRRATAVLAGLLLVAAPVVTGCGSDSETKVGSEQAFVAGDGSIVEIAPEERLAAPDLRGRTLTGEDFGLADHRGQVVVLNVWASWCAPCRSEAPGLAEVADSAQGVQFVGLVTRDSEASAKAFVDRFGLDYPQVLDADGALQLQFRDNLPPQAIPSTLVIDGQGRVAARVLGEASPATLRSLIANVQGADGRATPTATARAAAGETGDGGSR